MNFLKEISQIEKNTDKRRLEDGAVPKIVVFISLNSQSSPCRRLGDASVSQR